jgi:quinol monooxygenase YgiN
MTLIRIVRLTFIPEKVNTFLEIFNNSKEKIRNFENCLHLELLQDIQNPAIFTTYSHWKDENALNIYRDSELFKTTWAKTKILFADKPIAVSLKSIEKVL